MFYIYFVESDAWIKIGVTYRLWERIADIRRKSGKEIRLLGYICRDNRELAFRLETKLHHRFCNPIKGVHYARECFPKTREIYEYILHNCVCYDEIIFGFQAYQQPVKKWVKSDFHGEPCYAAVYSTS